MPLCAQPAEKRLEADDCERTACTSVTIHFPVGGDTHHAASIHGLPLYI